MADDLELLDATGEIEISDDDAAEASAELDQVDPGAVAGAFTGGAGGGLTDPEGWATAINGAKEQWFSMFHRQRDAQRSPCYQLAFLTETWRRWFTGTRGQQVRDALAALETQLARSVWQGTAWREQVAEVVRGHLRQQLWTCPDFGAVTAAQKRAVVRTKLPAADAIRTSVPSSYLNAGGCGAPVTNNAPGRYLLAGTGIFYDRVAKELFGPGLPELYELAGDEIDPVAVAPQLAARVAALRAAVAGLDEARATVLELFAEAREGCAQERLGLLPGVNPGGLVPVDPSSVTFAPVGSTSSGGINPLIAVGALALLLWAFSGSGRQ